MLSRHAAPPLFCTCTRARALWGRTRNLRKPRNTAKCLPTPSLHFCYPGTTALRFRPGRQPAVEPAAPLSGRHPHDARSSGSGLGAAPRSEFALQRQRCVRQAALEQLPTPMPFTTGSFRACASGLSDSEQWSSPVKPPRSQNYVKPHDARTRVHVAKVPQASPQRPQPVAENHPRYKVHRRN
jgi:hypothetical protein